MFLDNYAKKDNNHTCFNNVFLEMYVFVKILIDSNRGTGLFVRFY